LGASLKLGRCLVVARVIAKQTAIAGKQFQAVEADEETVQGLKPIPFP
jgi:Tfp pilus assembly major pilin PilA